MAAAMTGVDNDKRDVYNDNATTERQVTNPWGSTILRGLWRKSATVLNHRWDDCCSSWEKSRPEESAYQQRILSQGFACEEVDKGPRIVQLVLAWIYGTGFGCLALTLTDGLDTGDSALQIALDSPLLIRWGIFVAFGVLFVSTVLKRYYRDIAESSPRLLCQAGLLLFGGALAGFALNISANIFFLVVLPFIINLGLSIDLVVSLMLQQYSRAWLKFKPLWNHKKCTEGNEVTLGHGEHQAADAHKEYEVAA